MENPGKITVEDYTPHWPVAFQQIKEIYAGNLAEIVIDIHHVGSTAVPYLAAKPIIDIDLVVKSRRELEPVIKRLEQLGYQHRGNLGISDREAFKPLSEFAPVNNSGKVWHRHNLYVCPADSISLKNHLALRNFLRSNPATALEYGIIKKQLAMQNPYNIDLYVAGKTPFIISVLEKAGFHPTWLQQIIDENKAGR